MHLKLNNFESAGGLFNLSAFVPLKYAGLKRVLDYNKSSLEFDTYMIVILLLNIVQYCVIGAHNSNIHYTS